MCGSVDVLAITCELELTCELEVVAPAEPVRLPVDRGEPVGPVEPVLVLGVLAAGAGVPFDPALGVAVANLEAALVEPPEPLK
jgi:hypothetical protein